MVQPSRVAAAALKRGSVSRGCMAPTTCHTTQGGQGAELEGCAAAGRRASARGGAHHPGQAGALRVREQHAHDCVHGPLKAAAPLPPAHVGVRPGLACAFRAAVRMCPARPSWRRCTLHHGMDLGRRPSGGPRRQIRPAAAHRTPRREPRGARRRCWRWARAWTRATAAPPRRCSPRASSARPRPRASCWARARTRACATRPARRRCTSRRCAATADARQQVLAACGGRLRPHPTGLGLEYVTTSLR